jgi:hypothetical protein
MERYTPCSLIRRINVVTISILSKLDHRFIANLIKIPEHDLYRYGKEELRHSMSLIS